jgi:uncharacterized membrane protein HdeD (DUF308 family)
MTFPTGPEDSLNTAVLRLARSAWQSVLLIGVASVALGVLVLTWPHVSLRVAGVLFGVYLVISGVFQLAAAFGTHAATALRVLAFISGALSIALGVFCFRSALESVLLLAIWIGIGWLIRGLTQTLAAFSDPAVPARGRQIFFGIVTVLGGFVLIDAPLRSITVLAVVTGCWLVGLGILEIATALGIRRDTIGDRN